MNYCGWAGCGIPLAYKGRGRPPEYCPEHAAESKRRADNARPDYGRIRKRYPQCCLDAKAAGVRAYGSETISYPAYANWREVPPDAPFRYFVSYTRVVKVG